MISWRYIAFACILLVLCVLARLFLIKATTGNVTLLASLLLITFVITARLFEVLVSRWPYLHYYIGKPQWKPALGWWSVALFVIICAEAQGLG